MNAPRQDLVDAFRRHVCQTSPSPLGIVVQRAAGARLWDTDGTEYLDLLAGIGVAAIGHTHPEVVAAIEHQARHYLHAGVYGELIEEPQVELARRLAALTPGDLSTVYFTNSGAEAIEGALKTARKHTGRPGIVCFDGAFHGDTFGALSVGGNPIYRDPFEPLLPGVRRIPFDDVAALTQIDDSIAAVLIEPVQAEGGVRIPADDFLPAMRARCSEVGALLVFDEVLTGFGRTGRLFAAEHWGVTPDILVLAKALGGGMPLGAFVGRPAAMATLAHDPPLAHVTTFGGHPVCCAAGLAGLEVLLRDRLVERAARVGTAWREELRGLVGGALAAVRGIGLLLALEFTTPAATQTFVRRCFEERLILNWTLHRDTVVRLAPPLMIAESDLQQTTRTFAAILREIGT